MKCVNLIPAHRRDARRRRARVRRWLAVCVAHTGLLCAAYAACRGSLLNNADDAGDQLARATRQAEESDRTIAVLRPQVTEAQAKLGVARTVSGQPDWSLLLSIVSRTLGDDIVLSGCSLQPEKIAPGARPAAAPANGAAKTSAEVQRRTLALGGFGKSQSEVTQFALRLERLGLFERVDLLQ